MDQILVTYVYYEKDEHYLDNLKFFIKKAIPSQHSKYQIRYNIIVNGKCSLDLANILGSYTNITILYRENRDFDFGAHIQSIQHEVATSSIRNYKYAFFLNTSVRGPFLPPYYEGHYLDPFIQLFDSAPDVHLVGTTINILECSPTSREAAIFKRITNSTGPFTHVQTQMFGLTCAGLTFLINQSFFKPRPDEQKPQSDFVQFIAEREIMMSHLILNKAKLNIACLVPEYRGKDYRAVVKNFNPTARNGDPCFQGACFYRTLHPYEVIFPKINRGMMVTEIVSLSSST